MTKKIYIALITILVLVAGLSLSPALAKNDKDSGDDEQIIPEQDGIYDVPGHSELKLKVIVHNAKDKPGTAVSPALTCNLSDSDSAAIVDPAGWHLPSVWTYNLNPSSVPSSVGSAELSTIANLAFGNWSGASKGKVTFKAGQSTTNTRARFDGKNIIVWGTTSNSALAVTYIWYYPSTGLAAEVDTIMNQRVAWSWTNQAISPNCANSNSYDSQDILTHELGHWMGLNDEYTNVYTNNTMYGYGSKGEVKKDTLTTGDISGILNIYPVTSKNGK